MNTLHRIAVTVLFVAAGAIVTGCLLEAQEKIPVGTVETSEGALRAVATSQVRPVYPKGLVARQVNGVVVVLARFGPDGRFESSQVRQAPDPLLAEAVTQAVSQWLVKPIQVVGSTQAWHRQDKLTFYCSVTGGVGRCLDPDEVTGNEDVFDLYRKQRLQASGSGSPAVIQGSTGATPEIDATRLARLVADDRATVLDPRNRDEFARDHRPGSINIPADELTVRAGAELDRRLPIVVDCGQGDLTWCRMAADMLAKRRFAKVSVYIP